MKTPGEVAWTVWYTAGTLDFDPPFVHTVWQEQLPSIQERWERIATAVLEDAAQPPQEDASMSDTPTPGQRCYEAYCRAMQGTLIVPWRTVLPASKVAWEAAAQAVLAHCTPQEDRHE